VNILPPPAVEKLFEPAAERRANYDHARAEQRPWQTCELTHSEQERVSQSAQTFAEIDDFYAVPGFVRQLEDSWLPYLPLRLLVDDNLPEALASPAMGTSEIERGNWWMLRKLADAQTPPAVKERFLQVCLPLAIQLVRRIPSWPNIFHRDFRLTCLKLCRSMNAVHHLPTYAQQVAVTRACIREEEEALAQSYDQILALAEHRLPVLTCQFGEGDMRWCRGWITAIGGRRNNGITVSCVCQGKVVSERFFLHPDKTWHTSRQQWTPFNLLVIPEASIMMTVVLPELHGLGVYMSCGWPRILYDYLDAEQLHLERTPIDSEDAEEFQRFVHCQDAAELGENSIFVSEEPRQVA
jgi:hypothetical protein